MRVRGVRGEERGARVVQVEGGGGGMRGMGATAKRRRGAGARRRRAAGTTEGIREVKRETPHTLLGLSILRTYLNINMSPFAITE